MKKYVLFTLSCASVATILNASAPQEDTLFISLTRTPEKLSSLPTNVSIISSDQIRSAGGVSVADVLDLGTSVDLSKSGSLGTLTTARIRAVPSSANTQILINGLPINGISFQFIDLAQIPIENVERIEIIRGGSSVLYGANTTAGVVNIITKSVPAQGLTGKLKTEMGSFGSQTFMEDLSFSTGPWGVLGTARKFKTSGFQHNGSVEQNAVTGNIQYASEKGTSIGLELIKTDHSAGDPQGTLIPPGQWDGEVEKTPVNSEAGVERNDFNGRLRATVKAPSFEFQTQFYGTRNEYEAIDPFFPFKKKETVIGNDSRFIFKNGLSAGASFEKDRYFDITANTEYDISNFGFYAQQVWNWQYIYLTPAVRVDKHSEYEGTINPRLSANINLSPIWSVSANVGRSFRTPTFFELFYDNGTTQIKNPDLKPQSAWSYDLGQRFRIGNRQELKITAYFTEISDQIQMTNNNPYTTNIPDQYINHAKSEISGIETEWACFAWPVLTGELDTSFSITYQRAIGNSLGRSTYLPLKYTPRHLGNVQLNWTKNSWLWSHVVKMTSDQYSGDGYSGLHMNGYGTWDSMLRKRCGPLDLSASVKNITNKRYTENAAFGAYYPEPSRSYWLGIEWNFAGE